MTDLTVGSLCTGYGGLELAAADLFGDLTLTWVSEIDPDLTALLDLRFPDVANVGDITLDPDLPAVDVVTAGFPCQPFSTAGRKKGSSDERHIWPAIAAAVGRMDPRPRLLLLENVPGLLTIEGGDTMARVVSDLAELGYVGSYRLARASDIGACHQRRRLFIAAHLPDADLPGLQGSGPSGDPRDGAEASGPGRDELATGRDPRSAADSDGRRDGPLRRDGDRNGGSGDPAGSASLPRGPEVAHAADTPPGDRRPGGHPQLPTPQSSDGTRGPDFARAKHRRESHGSGGDDLTTAVAKMLPTPTAVMGSGGNTARSGDRRDELLLGGLLRSHDPRVWGPYADALDRHAAVVGSEAPGPVVDGKLNPGFVEWMMMLPAGWVTDPDLGLTRSAQLRILGNGVVPPQAAATYRSLL